MRTIALRFSNNFVPEIGTIGDHNQLIDELGYAWYGKLGSKISTKVAGNIMNNTEPRILLIHSGGVERYWAYIDDIQWEKPRSGSYPSYYEQAINRFKTWFRVIKIEEAPSDIMANCYVASSGASLAHASRSSMSPYFIIETE